MYNIKPSNVNLSYAYGPIVPVLGTYNAKWKSSGKKIPLVFTFDSFKRRKNPHNIGKQVVSSKANQERMLTIKNIKQK